VKIAQDCYGSRIIAKTTQHSIVMISSAATILTVRPKLWLAMYSLVAIALSGCQVPKDNAGAQTTPPGAGRNQPAAVNVAIAATVPLVSTREYTGTTQPLQEVAIRAQAEGQLRQLNVDVGDRIQRGQTLAQIDDSLLNAATAEAAAELASRRTEISQIQAQVSDAQTQVEQTRLQLQQAQFDAARYDSLAKAGGNLSATGATIPHPGKHCGSGIAIGSSQSTSPANTVRLRAESK
jgi:multidrug efflux pump subunit AcrA (membrane-fusion protein)